MDNHHHNCRRASRLEHGEVGAGEGAEVDGVEVREEGAGEDLEPIADQLQLLIGERSASDQGRGAQEGAGEDLELIADQLQLLIGGRSASDQGRGAQVIRGEERKRAQARTE